MRYGAPPKFQTLAFPDSKPAKNAFNTYPTDNKRFLGVIRTVFSTQKCTVRCVHNIPTEFPFLHLALVGWVRSLSKQLDLYLAWLGTCHECCVGVGE